MQKIHERRVEREKDNDCKCGAADHYWRLYRNQVSPGRFPVNEIILNTMKL